MQQWMTEESLTCVVVGCSAVKYQMQLHGKTLKPGDVLMTNSPHAGGSYVPPTAFFAFPA